MRCLYVCSLLFLPLFVVASLAQEEAPAGNALFDHKTFALPGRVRLVLVEDMDADGLKDLLVFYTRGEYPHTERRGCIFWQEPGESFPGEPNQCWPIPREASLVDTGDMDGAPGRELFYMTPKGLIHSPLLDRKYRPPTPLITQETYLHSSSVQELPEVDFVRDWDGDGADEALLLKPEKALLYKRHPDGGLVVWSESSLTPRAYLRGAPPPPSLEMNYLFRQSLWMPEIKSIDFNGDGRRDLVAIWMDELAVHLQEEGGLFPRQPSATYFFNLLSERERTTGRTTVHAEVEDLQGDGKMDLVLSTVEGGITSIKSKIMIYYNENDELNPASTDLTIREVKGAAGAILHDANGDGRWDLIVPSMETGVLSYIKMFVTRRITVTFSFYLMDQEGRYPDKPDLERELKFAIDLGEGNIVGALPRLNGDFNGDGRKDVVFAADREMLTVVFQGKDEIFPSEKSHTVEVPISKQMIVGDIDRDGLSDIIMFYPFHDTQEGVVRLLHNVWKKPTD